MGCSRDAGPRCRMGSFDEVSTTRKGWQAAGAGRCGRLDQEVGKMMRSREERFAAFASMARRDIEQSTLMPAAAGGDGGVEWVATPGAWAQMRMQGGKGTGPWPDWRTGRWQESFEDVREQLREQSLFMQQLRDSQQEQKSLQQQLLKLITYGMIGGVRDGVATPAHRGVNTQTQTESSAKLMLKLKDDPAAVQEVVTNPSGDNSCNAVITWLGSGESGRHTAHSKQLQTAEECQLVKSVGLGEVSGREGSAGCATGDTDAPTVLSVPAAPQPAPPPFDPSAYVILPVRRRRPLSPSIREQRRSQSKGFNSLTRDSGLSEEKAIPGKEDRFKYDEQTHCKSVKNSNGLPYLVEQLQEYVNEVQDLENEIRSRWLNPEMDKLLSVDKQTVEFSFSNLDTACFDAPSDTLPTASHVQTCNISKTATTDVTEHWRATTWLTEIILDSVLEEVGKELYSHCDEFVEHICRCEFIVDVD